MKNNVHTKAPIYSHKTYDRVVGETIDVKGPRVLILEGINALQDLHLTGSQAKVTDYTDFNIYVDADTDDIKQWYIERLRALVADKNAIEGNERLTTLAQLTDSELIQAAETIWKKTNGPNLSENILPTRERADIIISKGKGHTVVEVKIDEKNLE